MNFDFYRTIYQKKSVIIFSTILLIMLADLGINLLWQFGREHFNYMTFLTAQHLKFLQMLILWLLPIWLLLYTSERYINDKKLGYDNILIGKLGKEKYIFTLIRVTFISGFLLLFVPLLINYILAFLTSWDVPQTSSIDYLYLYQGEAKYSPQYFAWTNPILINMLFIIVSSFTAGLLAVTSLCVSFVIPDKRIVYPFMYLFWFGQIIIRNGSVMDIFQPFTEWGWDRLGFVFIRTLIICLIIIVPTTVYKLRRNNVF